MAIIGNFNTSTIYYDHSQTRYPIVLEWALLNALYMFEADE